MPWSGRPARCGMKLLALMLREVGDVRAAISNKTIV
jgi:hypothetical protein